MREDRGKDRESKRTAHEQVSSPPRHRFPCNEMVTKSSAFSFRIRETEAVGLGKVRTVQAHRLEFGSPDPT